MFKPTSRRKQENHVWKYFAYEAPVDKSCCKVEDCGSAIKGKNATNLVNHLKSKHKETAVDLEMAEKKRKSNDRKMPWQPATTEALPALGCRI